MQTERHIIQARNQDLILTPRTEKHTDTLIFLHGLGDSANGWVDIFLSGQSPCPNSTKVVLLTAPTAPVTANGGYPMPSWYDIKKFGGRAPDELEKTIGKDEVISNGDKIRRILDEEIEVLKGESKSVIIGGFSQGCAMSMHTGLEYNKSLGGIMGWSGYLFPFTKVSQENEKVPIFLSHGADDQVVPYKMSELSFKRLDANKHYLVKIVEEGLEHSITDRILKEAGSFMRKVLKKV